MARQWMQHTATGSIGRGIMAVMLTALALICASCAEQFAGPPLEPVTGSCSVTDGDTIRCGDERIRLLAIDAPELPGHCRAGRDCAPGDPYASTANLEANLRGQVMLQRVGEDRYGRTLAVVWADGVNLACLQLSTGHAIYVERWDNGGLIAISCPAVVN